MRLPFSVSKTSPLFPAFASEIEARRRKHAERVFLPLCTQALLKRLRWSRVSK